MSVYQHQPMPALILKILSVDLPSMSKVRGLSLFFVPRVVPRFWPEPSRPSLVPDFVPHFAGLPSVVSSSETDSPNLEPALGYACAWLHFAGRTVAKRRGDERDPLESSRVSAAVGACVCDLVSVRLRIARM